MLDRFWVLSRFKSHFVSANMRIKLSRAHWHTSTKIEQFPFLIAVVSRPNFWFDGSATNLKCIVQDYNIQNKICRSNHLKSNYSSEAVVRSMYQLHSGGHCWSIRSSHHVIYNYATTSYLWENLNFATYAISSKARLFARFVRSYRCIKSQKCIESMSKQNVLHVLPSYLSMYQFENRVHTRPPFNWSDNQRSPLPFSCSIT